MQDQFVHAYVQKLERMNSCPADCDNRATSNFGIARGCILRAASRDLAAMICAMRSDCVSRAA